MIYRANVWLATDLEVRVEGTNAVLDGVRADGAFVGFSNACAVRTDGSLWCWGPNDNAQLARPIDAHTYLAVPIALPL